MSNVHSCFRKPQTSTIFSRGIVTVTSPRNSTGAPIASPNFTFELSTTCCGVIGRSAPRFLLGEAGRVLAADNDRALHGRGKRWLPLVLLHVCHRLLLRDLVLNRHQSFQHGFRPRRTAG